MTRKIYYQQYRCDSTRTTAQPAHDLSPPPRPRGRRARRWGRGLLWFSSLASQQGRVSRGALPVAGQRQRLQPRRAAAGRRRSRGHARPSARLSLNITSIRTGVWAGFEVTSLSALVDASLVSITYSAACAGQHIS